MHAQRTTISIAAGAGGLGTFLPWISMGAASIAGTAGDGWVTLGLFAICLIAALPGDRQKPLHFVLLCAVVFPAMLAAAVGVSKLSVFHPRTFNSDLVRLGPGVYLVLIAALVTILASTLLAPQMRKVGTLLLCLSAAGIVAGIAMFAWWKFTSGGEVGLLGYSQCDSHDENVCQTIWFFDVPDAVLDNWTEHKKTWRLGALIATVTSALAILAHLGSGIAVWAQKRTNVMGMLSLVLSVLSLASLLVWITDAPNAMSDVPLGVGAPLMVAGAVLGALGGLILARSEPLEATWVDDFEPAVRGVPEVPLTCPRCARPTTWAETRGAHYCAACRDFV